MSTIPHPSPSGESETLEALCDEIARLRAANHEGYSMLLAANADLEDARAEVERLTAEREAAEARVARLEEALKEIIEWAKYERTGLTARGANRIVGTAEDALTEGGEHADD